MHFSLCYSDGLHLVEKCNLELRKSVLKVIDSPLSLAQKSETATKMQCVPQILLHNLEDFPTLPSIVPVRNSVSFSKSIVKLVSYSSVCPGKLICDSNVPPSKPVGPGFVHTGKSISNKNFRPIKTVSASSLSPGRPICGSNVTLSKHVSTFNVHPSKPIISSNIRSSKPVGASSICSSKPIFGSSVRTSKPICALNVCAGKPIREHVSVNDVLQSEPISSSHARSSNIISASNICPSKSVSASNVWSCLVVCTKYVRPSRSICGGKVCQNNPTSDCIIHHKTIRPNHICFVDSSVSTQQISFIILLSLLAFSVYYKYNIFEMNIFINLFLVILILLTKLTCFSKFL